MVAVVLAAAGDKYTVGLILEQRIFDEGQRNMTCTAGS
jgi:hypothetical protein